MLRFARNASDQYGAFKVGTHDDLVTALGLAVLCYPPRTQDRGRLEMRESMGNHRLWAGVLMLLAATALQVTADGGWALALIAVLGILLVLTSFTPEKAR